MPKMLSLLGLFLAVTVHAKNDEFDTGFLLRFDANLPGGYESTIEAAIGKQDSLLGGIFFTPKGKPTRFYPLGDLKKGILIIKTDDEKIAFLQSDDFSPQEGGVLNLIFKRKLGGVDFRKIQLNLVRLSRTEFRVETVFPNETEWKSLDRVKAKIQLLSKTIDSFDIYLKNKWVESIKTLDLPKAKPLSKRKK